eukprot:1852501-Heterocapsa_arctica.AAC.1
MDRAGNGQAGLGGGQEGPARQIYTMQTERYLSAHNRKRQTELIRQKIQELGLVIPGGEPKGGAVEGNQPRTAQE